MTEMPTFFSDPSDLVVKPAPVSTSPHLESAQPPFFNAERA